MKKVAPLILAGVLFVALSGCAMNQDKMKTDSMANDTMHGDMMKDEIKVKCPACGFEFNLPSDA